MTYLEAIDKIRREPFACKVPDWMQDEIAADIRRAVHAEGHRRAFPPVPDQSKEPKPEKPKTTRRPSLRDLAARARDAKVVRYVSNGIATAAEIAETSRMSKTEISNSLGRLVAQGRLIRNSANPCRPTYTVAK